MRHRVIQWTTGNVGQRSLKAIIRNPDLELVGVYAHGADKVGKDAADLCGWPEPTGVLATNDVDALLALRPDVCIYNPRWPNVDELVRLLEHGVNVVTTAAFIDGRAMGPDAQDRIRAAAERGGVSIHGTGMNPGLANVLAIVSTQVCERVDQVRVLESVDSTGYDSFETEAKIGFGQPPDAPGLVENAREAVSVFGDAVAVMADALGVELDEITFDIDFGLATADNELGYVTIRSGCVSAVDGRWRGRAGGRDVIVLRYQWTKGRHTEPLFKVRHGYFIEIDGMPSVRTHLLVMPPPDWNEDNYMGLGMIMTAMPAVNAIDAVIKAPPGIVWAHQMNSYAAHGFVS
jgi:4-hydroxy-tetrahydrodipicolinate reductase